MAECSKLDWSELKTKDSIASGEYLFESVMLEGKEPNKRMERRVRMMEEGLLCYEVYALATQSNQPCKVHWTVLMEEGSCFELLFTANQGSNENAATQQSQLAGIRLAVGSERVHYIYHVQQEVLRRLQLLLSARINQLGFKSLFRPLKKIGKGNFGSVYMAQRIEDGRKVAVKAFSKEASYSQDKGRESLVNEINMLRKVSHPNIVELIGVFESENSLYMVMENLEGGHLMSKLEAGYKFTEPQIKRIIGGLLKGLAHMNSRRIMHRDLKPQNLLFRSSDTNSQIVIADFGLAADVDAEKHLFVRCGTPGFVAPEIINIVDLKTRSDPICDVFSAGVIFHMLLLERSVFPSKVYDKILIENRACDFKLEGPEYAKLNPQALDLLSLMLQVNPKSRIRPSAALRHPYLWERHSSMIRELSSKCLTPLLEQQQPTVASQLHRRNSCDRTDPFRLSLNKAQQKHKKHLEMLRDWDKENACLPKPNQTTSLIKKKSRF